MNIMVNLQSLPARAKFGALAFVGCGVLVALGVAISHEPLGSAAAAAMMFCMGFALGACE